MKTISARQFRLNFQELTEPVQVQRRRASGEYEIVGTWSPATVSEDRLVQMLDQLQEERSVLTKTGIVTHPFRPVPKPESRRGGK